MPETEPPAPLVETPRGESGRRISLVWLVPLLALLISLAVAWRSYSERGPLIEIVFDSAAGIEAGDTTLRFRNVTVGMVEDVSFTEDLQSVAVAVRLEKSVAPYVDEDAQFWVVRPSVTAQGVTGIETVLSGVYLEAYWDGTPGERQDVFEGLPRPPLTPADQPGLRVRLRAPDGGSVIQGAPVLFKSIQVGKIESIDLVESGDVMIDVFVDAPYHLRLTEATRFWNASGFSIQLGAQGAALNVDSLVSLLQGGVAFDTVGSDLDPVEPGHVYELYESESAARQNAFEDTPGSRLRVDVYFDSSVRGLEPGAAVEYRGVRVGEVEALQAAVVTDRPGAPQILLRTTLGLVPQRLGIATSGEADAVAVQDALDLLEAQVAQGLRARLAAGGLLSQNLYVDLVTLPEAEPAALQPDAEPYPVLPSAPSDVSGLAASAEGVLQRVSNLPIEELLANAVALLDNVNALLTDDAIRSAPENLGLLLADLRALVNDSGLMEAPGDVRAVLATLQEVIDDMAERQLVASLAQTLEAAEAAAASVSDAAEGVPELLAEIEALSAQARALPLDALVRQASGVLASADALLASEGAQALPASLGAALEETRRLLADLRDGGAVENATAALASLRTVAEQLAAADLAASLRTVVQEARVAIGNVGTASSDLPALIQDLSTLAERASDLPLDALVASATDVLDRAEVFLGSGEAESVPVALVAALDETRALLADLRTGGAVENLNATLASADAAAAAVEAAAADLPALVAQLEQTAARADQALGGFSPGSEISRDAQLVLREVREAARAVNDLVTALERRPNSVLFGR